MLINVSEVEVAAVGASPTSDTAAASGSIGLSRLVNVFSPVAFAASSGSLSSSETSSSSS